MPFVLRPAARRSTISRNVTSLSPTARVSIAGVVLEHLLGERRRVRAADDDVRLRLRARIASATSATPRRFAVQHDMPKTSASSAAMISSTFVHGNAERFSTLTWCPARIACAPSEKQAVRRLVEVRVEIALAVLGRRAVPAIVGRLTAGRDLPRRRIEERDAHRWPPNGTPL